MRKHEQYQDIIFRLFPELEGNVKTVTFQVTDACNLACFVAGTKILMGDYTYKNIEDIKYGDIVMGFNELSESNGSHRKMNPTKVTHTFYRHDRLMKITTSDGAEITCTSEHPFLNGRGEWKRAEDLNVGNKLSKFHGIREHTEADIWDKDYMIGYIISSWLGDGNMKYFKHGDLRKEDDITCNQTRLALKDTEAIRRICEYFDIMNIEYDLRPYEISPKYQVTEDAIYLKQESSLTLRDMILDNLNINENYNYMCGFLAGIIDTEGNVSTQSTTIRIFNSNKEILRQCEKALSVLNFEYTYDKPKQSVNVVVETIRVINPRNTTRTIELLKVIKNAIPRKNISSFKNMALYERIDIVSIEYLAEVAPVYNLETDSSTYIANDFMVHNCKYCYQINKGTRHMSFDIAKKTIDLLLSGEKNFSAYIGESPAIIIEFIGGEPFMEIDLIDKVCDYFIKRCIELNHPWAEKHIFSICSNGVLYFDPRVQRFLNKHKHNISFSITIDGNKELHDSCRIFHDGSPSYDIAIAGAMDWVSRGYYMGSKITIAPENLQYIFDAVKHMISLGYDDINANTVYEKGWEQHHSTELYYELKKISDYLLKNDLEEDIYVSLYSEEFFKPLPEEMLQNWCGGTGSMLAIDPDGFLYPCIRYMESSLGCQRTGYRIGNVNDGIMSNETECDRVKCLNCINRRTQSTDECFNCPIADGCSWCSGYNYQMTGTPDQRVTYSCEMHKARALANAYYWSKYYEKYNIDKVYELHVPTEWALKIIPQEEWEMLKSLENCIHIEETKN